MDILKQNIAPISEDAWTEIKDEASNILKILLTSRRFVDIEGPKGWDFAAVSDGTIHIPKGKNKNDKNYGYFNVQPLIECRIPFKLNKFELDNISRGHEDVDFSNMEDAAVKLAQFEDKAIMNGFSATNMKGLKNSSEHKSLKLPQNMEDLPAFLAKAVNELTNAFVEGPYALVLNPKKWEQVNAVVKGYPLKKTIADIISGPIIQNMSTDDCFLVSQRGGDLKMTIGKDISIGYDYYNQDDVELYFTETFAFQIIDPASFIQLI